MTRGPQVENHRSMLYFLGCFFKGCQWAALLQIVFHLPVGAAVGSGKTAGVCVGDRGCCGDGLRFHPSVSDVIPGISFLREVNVCSGNYCLVCPATSGTVEMGLC